MMTAHPLALFVCLHGSAKSLIAAEHFNRLAAARGIEMRAVSAGVEPDAAVPLPVVAGLGLDGFPVAAYQPRALNAAEVHSAAVVVTFGCEVGETNARAVRRDWADLPMVSDGFAPARDAIVRRVEALIADLEATQG
jgi:arsenate reductase